MLKLTISDTNALKGLALLLLLFHHLFYKNPGIYDDIHLIGNYNLVQTIGKIAHLCVAMFVFLSGYGLTMKYLSLESLQKKDFYISRFTKLMFNYWFIWLLFMPISIFLLGPTFEEKYGSYALIKLILDFFGIINVVGWYGYNATWWFYSCIIVLYAIYPLLFNWEKQGKMTLMMVVSIILFLIPFDIFLGARKYLSTFIVGIYFVRSTKSPPQYMFCFR